MAGDVVIGIDPGVRGGACLIDHAGRPLMAWVWTPDTRGIRVRRWVERGQWVERGMPYVSQGPATPKVLAQIVGMELGQVHRERMVYEGLFVGASRSSSATSTLLLAEWVGEHRAALRDYADVVADRPLAQTWRAQQLGRGWGQARRKEAEAEAVRRASWLPSTWTLAERGAAAEAWLIARYAEGCEPVGEP